MRIRHPHLHVLSALTLAIAIPALAQDASGTRGDNDRNEALEESTRAAEEIGVQGNNPGAAATHDDNNHADADNCAALLAQEDRTRSNSGGNEETGRQGGTGQAERNTDRAPTTSAGGTGPNEGLTGNVQGSSERLNQGNADLTLEECRNRQNAIPNGRPNGSGQGANQTGPSTANQGPGTRE